MSTDAPRSASRSTALELARREERALSWLRTVGGLLMVAVLPSFSDPLPTGGVGWAQAVSLLATFTGVVGLRVVTPELSVRSLLRFRLFTLTSDAAITLLFTALYVEQPALALFVLSLPIQGAMKFGARGAVAMTLVSATAGFTSQGLRSLIVDAPIDASLAWAPVLPGIALGFMVALIASTRALENVESLRIQGDLERHVHEGRVAHEIIAADTPAPEAAATLLQQIVDHGAAQLVTLLDARGTQPTEVLTVLEPGQVRTAALYVDPAGPTLEAIRTNRVVDGGPRDAQVHRGLVGGRAVIALPVASAGRVVAVVVAETCASDRFAPDAVTRLQQAAHHIALTVGFDEVRAERIRLEAEIRQLENARDQVLAIGSHELRTPLTSLIGFSEVLATHGEQLSPHEVVLFGRTMQGSAQRLLRTLSDVRLADSLRRGTLRTAAEPFEIGSVASRVAEMWPGTVIRTGGRTRVTADPVHLGTVLERLVDNAWQHGRGRDVEVGWTRVGDHVLVSVSDGGPGLPAHLRDTAATPFTQGEPILRHQRGTGLGLTIAQGLCEAMDAMLVLAETGPQGTRWEVWLPTRPPSPSSPPTPQERRRSATPGATGPDRAATPANWGLY